MKKTFNEFKAFIAKGNVLDLAVAVIIGGAFGKIVTSLVNDIIMPLIGVITGGLNVSDWKWVISAAQIDTAGNVLKEECALCYGNFIQTIIDFLIIAVCIFLVVKAASTLKQKVAASEQADKEPEVPAVPCETTESILSDIRTLLSENK